MVLRLRKVQSLFTDLLCVISLGWVCGKLDESAISHIQAFGCQKQSNNSGSKILDKMQIVLNALKGKRALYALM